MHVDIDKYTADAKYCGKMKWADGSLYLCPECLRARGKEVDAHPEDPYCGKRPWTNGDPYVCPLHRVISVNVI